MKLRWMVLATLTIATKIAPLAPPVNSQGVEAVAVESFRRWN